MKSLFLLQLLFCVATVQAGSLSLCYEDVAQAPGVPGLNVGGTEVYGHHAAIVVAAFQAENQQFKLQRLPWTRCLAKVAKGEIDAAIGVGWTEERGKSMAFPFAGPNQPDERYAILSLSYFVYTHVDSSLQWDGKNFSQVQFGISAPKGFVAEQKLAELGVLANTESDMGSALRLTLSRRIDGYVLVSAQAEQQLKDSGSANKIKQLQPEFLRQPLFLAFSHQASRSNTAQMKAIWQRIPKIRAGSGTVPDPTIQKQ